MNLEGPWLWHIRTGRCHWFPDCEVLGHALPGVRSACDTVSKADSLVIRCHGSKHKWGNPVCWDCRWAYREWLKANPYQESTMPVFKRATYSTDPAVRAAVDFVIPRR